MLASSGNENYGFIGQRSGFGGNRLRLCTSNLLLNDNLYQGGAASSGGNFYIDSELNKRLSRSAHYIDTRDTVREEEEQEEEEEEEEVDDELYPRDSYSIRDTIRGNSGFLNSVLRHLPLSTITSKQGRSGKYSLNYHSSWKRLSFPAIFTAPPGHNQSESYLSPSMSSAGDSDNSYTHIYSSICDSAVGTSASIRSNSLYLRNTRQGTSCSSGYADYSDNSFAKKSQKKNTFINRMLSKSRPSTIDYTASDRLFNGCGGNGVEKVNPSNINVGTVRSKIMNNSKKYSTMSMPSISLDEERCKSKHTTLNGHLDDSFALGARPRSRSHQVDNKLKCFNDATRSSSDFTLLSSTKLYSMANCSIDNVQQVDDNKSTPVSSTTAAVTTSTSNGKTNGLVKLARKGSRGLKRATSIPKTLKLFIKRNGKRGISE